MSLTTTIAVNKELGYFHREYKNDVGGKATQYSWINQGQRLALVSLPFVSLYKPISSHLAIGMGSLRAVTNLGQLGYIIYQGKEKRKEIPLQLFHTTIAAISLAGTIFAHPIGMIITTVQDLVIEAVQLTKHLEKGDYEKAIGSCISIINNSLYLALLYYGGIPLTIASLALQILGGIYHSQAEFKNGHYLEGSGHIAMALIRGNQLIGQVKILQMKLGIEKLLIKAEAKKKNEKVSPMKAGEERITLSLKNSDTVTVLQSDKILTEQAIKGSNEVLINILIRYGNNCEGIPVLHYAIFKNDENAVRLLLSHGANPQALAVPSFQGFGQPYPLLPLDYASSNGNINIIQLLIEHGADVNYNKFNGKVESQFLRGYSPLYFAAKEDKEEAVRFLIAKGARIEPEIIQPGNTFPDYSSHPLFVAAQSGSVNAFRALVDSGAKLAPLLYKQPYLLHIAAQNNHSKIIQFLIDRGIHPDIRADGGRTPLMQARGIESFNVLLDAGADPKAVDQNGCDALLLMTMSGPDIKSTESLLARGVDINTPRNTNSPMTPFFSAVMHLYNFTYLQKDWQAYLQFLLDKGADINAKCLGDQTALSRAKSAQMHEVVEWLIKHGAK